MPTVDVVFTALFGGYESLNELEIKTVPQTRYICFTDDPSLRSKTWEVKVVAPEVASSPARSSRKIKMLGHRYFPEGTRCLYIDNTVRLKVDGSKILDFWLKYSDVAFMVHDSRKTVRGEFFACSAYGLDDQAKIWDQYTYYLKNCPTVLAERPHWGGIIAIVNTPESDKFMETWKEQFDRFTKRDQLSLNASSIFSGVRIGSIEGGNDFSIWHEWPNYNNRKLHLRDNVSGRSFRRVRILINGLRFGYRYYIPKLWNSKSFRSKA